MSSYNAKSIFQFAIDPIWEEAACVSSDTELFFSLDPLHTKIAKQICDNCPIRIQCLNYAIAAKIEYGVFGGYTGDERKKIK
jgi:WhiB family redox-sensing transcriptional regulator